MTALFILYAGIIPLVPLVGAGIFKRREDNRRRNICYGLFGAQLVLSAVYVASYLSN